MKVQSVLVGAALAGTAAADTYHYYTDAELTLMGCKGAVYSTAHYCTTDSAKAFKCNCKNQAAMGSLLYCLYDNLGLYNEKGGEMFIEYCAEVNVTLTQEKLKKSYDNATSYLFDPKTVDGFNKTAISYKPAIYNKKSYHNYYTSLKTRWRNVSDSLYMGAGLLGYWLLIIVIATIYNVLQQLGFVGKYFKSGPINWIRRYITLPSLFSNKRHTHPVTFLKIFSGFVPTRWETVVIFCYFALLFIFTGVRYHFVQDDTIWKNHEAQRARYPGDRTGILLVFTFQLSYLFAGRNNFLLYLTGWKQSTFLTYHKWVSRFNFIVLLIHAGSMHAQSAGLGSFGSRVLEEWYQMGIVASICCGILVFTGSYHLRKRYYEIFLAIHFVFAAVLNAASWIHCKEFGFQQGFYATTAVWGFDRLVRILRILAYGVQQAQVTVVSDEILKVVVPRRGFWKTYPGAYGYLHYLKPTTFLQSHPFTIVDTSETSVTFYTKIKGGITTQIHRSLRNLPNQTGPIKVLVEGPYGNPFPVQRYDTSLFYTGGTGIAGPYSHILSLIRSGKQQHIKLYWVIKSLRSLEWFREELLKLKGTAANVIIYVTRPDGSELLTSESDQKNSSNDEAEKAELGAVNELDFIEFRYGRPNIDELVANDIKEANGNVAVITAAHNSLVDDVRFAVGENLNNTKYRVDYVEELQAW